MKEMLAEVAIDPWCLNLEASSQSSALLLEDWHWLCLPFCGRPGLKGEGGNHSLILTRRALCPSVLREPGMGRGSSLITTFCFGLRAHSYDL